MSQTQRFFKSSLLIAALSLTMFNLGSANDDRRGDPQITLEQQKNQYIRLFNCGSLNDSYCQAIRGAQNFDALMSAAQQKKESDEKKKSDRLNVLECCLDIDKYNTCRGLSEESRKDLKSCQDKLKNR